MLPTDKRILIVDDDALIRRWLSMLFMQMGEDGIEIFEADNGEEALRLCRGTPMTMVVTDIKMPVMDGLTLIKILKEEQPQVRTAVLSAFDDFEYVQVALRYGALDYILKVQMQLDDIHRLMQKLQENLNFEAGLKNNVRSYQKKSHEDYKRYVDYLSNHDVADEEFLLQLHPQLKKEALHLFMMRIIPSGAETPYEICSAIYSAVSSASIPCSVFPTEKNLYLLIASPAQNNVNPQEDSIMLLASINQNLMKFANTNMTQNIQIACNREDSIRSQISFMYELIDYQAYYNVSLVSRDVIHRPVPTEQLYKQMRPAFEAQDTLKSTDVLMKFVDDCHNAQALPSHIRNAVSTCAYLMVTSLLQGEEKDELHVKQLTSLIHEFEGATSCQQFRMSVSAFCETLLKTSRRNQYAFSVMVRKAIDYIDRHSATRLTLDEVAEHVSLNSSYLSSLFSKEVGMSFTNYIEDVRIQKAKRLLQAGQQNMQEISESVGYASQNYFSKVFRKKTGMSPSQYQKLKARVAPVNHISDDVRK